MTSLTDRNVEAEDDFEPEQEDDFELEATQPQEQPKSTREMLIGAENQDYFSRTKGLLSGATLGLTENIPGLEVEEGLTGESGKFFGSLIPISKLYNLFTNPLVNAATKSPIMQKQLSALARLTGAAATGASVEGIQEVFKGEMPSLDNMLEHGAYWAAIDAALGTLGLGARFIAGLLNKGKQAAKPTFEVLNEVVNEMRAQGEDFTIPERVAYKAMSILEKEPGISTRELALPEVAPAMVAENVAKERLAAPLEEATIDLGSKKVDPKYFNRIEVESPSLSEPYKPSEINANQIMEDINKSNIEERIGQISSRAATERQLGENVKNSVAQEMEAAENLYKPLYQKAEQEAQGIAYVPRRSAQVASETLRRVQALETKPTGYSQVIKTLESALEDLGYVIERGVDGRFSGATIAQTGSRLNELMELGRRLNEIINYDVIDNTIKDRLRPLARTIKSEIREALEARPEGLEAFNQAEAFFGETAQTFNKPNIRAIRQEDSLEKIAQTIGKSPSALHDLKPILSSSQMKEVEREVLENINAMSHENAKKAVRELGPALSPESRKVAEEIVESKLPLGKKRQIQKIQNSVFNDLSKAISTGRRPEQALKLWKTKEGQEIIRDGLRNNPNRREILNYLREQSLFDFATSVVDKSGKIDFKKFNEYLKDPATLENLRSIGGEDAVKFFRQLESLSEEFKHNLSLVERIPNVEKLQKGATKGKEILKKTKAKNEVVPKEKAAGEEAIREEVARRTESTKELGKERLGKMARKERPLHFKIKDILDGLGIPGKTVLGMLGVLKYGTVETAGGYYGLRFMYKLANSARSRRAFKKAVKSSGSNPSAFFAAMKTLEDELEE